MPSMVIKPEILRLQRDVREHSDKILEYFRVAGHKLDQEEIDDLVADPIETRELLTALLDEVRQDHKPRPYLAVVGGEE